MLIVGHANAAHLNVSKARSRVGAYIMLSKDLPVPAHNGPVLTITQIIKSVMSSAAEAEIASLFTIAKEMIPLRQALTEMGWPQSATPIQCDNSTAVGVCQRNNNSSEDKIHGYELPLATLQRITEAISNLLARRQSQLR